MAHVGKLFFKECVLDGKVFVRTDSVANCMKNLQDQATSRGSVISGAIDPTQVDIARLINPAGQAWLAKWKVHYAERRDVTAQRQYMYDMVVAV
jgi:hypothetical protein